MKFDFNNIFQGLSGNMNQSSAKELEEQFGDYLLDDETIETGYILLRDSIIFTNLRIIFIDKQGTTGKKTAIRTIFLSQIINIEMETAGRGFDDSEVTIYYLENVYLRSREERISSQTFEFPKKTDITNLYKYLLNLSLLNRSAIND